MTEISVIFLRHQVHVFQLGIGGFQDQALFPGQFRLLNRDRFRFRGLTVKDTVTAPAKADQVTEKAQFPAPVLIGSVMSLKVMGAVADLASVFGPFLNGGGYLLPVIGFQIGLIVHCWDAEIEGDSVAYRAKVVPRAP